MPVTHRSAPAPRAPAAPDPGAGSDATPSDAPPAVAVRDLSFTYTDGRPALSHVTFEVGRGEKVALVGPNGAGKSTLMLHLNGILGARGEVTVNGLPVTAANIGQVRALVGLVFQNPDDQLFSPTVYEDVAFGPLHMGMPEATVGERVADALARVGMHEFGPRLSHHLSVGEKKRIAIATVLAMAPALLVLDEPSAGLDPRARRKLIALLRDLPLTMLVATHDMALVRDLLPRMMVMDGGRIVADGSTEALFRDVAFLETHGLERP
jgi:cobalt/nickel transport system ATP-binding protein